MGREKRVQVMPFDRRGRGDGWLAAGGGRREKGGLSHTYTYPPAHSQELNYRATVIVACTSLSLLDSSPVTPAEREAAVQLFTTKKIQKRLAFGTLLLPWDKPVAPPRGTRSQLESDLLRAVQVKAWYTHTMHHSQSSPVLRTLIHTPQHSHASLHHAILSPFLSIIFTPLANHIHIPHLSHSYHSSLVHTTHHFNTPQTSHPSHVTHKHPIDFLSPFASRRSTHTVNTPSSSRQMHAH